MKTSLISSFALVGMTLALGLSPASAQARGDHGGRGGDRHERMMKKLDLTDAQKAKLKELKESDKDKAKATRAKIQESRKKLRAALSSDASKDELKKLHEELQSQRRAVDDQRFEKILAIREILTPEQRKKFGELRSEGGGRRHRGGGHHRERGSDDDSDEGED